MWILLNNKPVNILTAKIKIGDMHFADPRKWSKEIRDCLKDTQPYYSFIVDIDDDRIISKRYSTKEEAEEARNNLLEQINKIVASLPRINI